MFYIKSMAYWKASGKVRPRSCSLRLVDRQYLVAQYLIITNHVQCLPGSDAAINSCLDCPQAIAA